jgi:hypothetical protein
MNNRIYLYALKQLGIFSVKRQATEQDKYIEYLGVDKL